MNSVVSTASNIIAFALTHRVLLSRHISKARCLVAL